MKGFKIIFLSIFCEKDKVTAKDKNKNFIENI